MNPRSISVLAPEQIHFKRRVNPVVCCSPRSHALTRSSLQDVIGSMLGVLLESLVHFPAFLVDFYLSWLLEERGKQVEEEEDLESDEDEWHSFVQVTQVRVNPHPFHSLSANSAEELSGSRRSTHPSSLPTVTYPAALDRTWSEALCEMCVRNRRTAEGFLPRCTILAPQCGFR